MKNDCLRMLILVMVCGWLAQAPVWALDPQTLFKDSFLNLKEDSAEAGKAGRLLMVLYEQEGCPYCAQMQQVHFRNDAIAERIRRHFDVIQLDIWGGREVIGFDGEAMTEKAMARKLNVQFSPTVAFYDGGGKEVYRMAGLHKPETFLSELDFLASRAYTRMRFSEYAAQHTVGAASLPDEVFFARGSDLQSLAKAAKAQDKIVALLFVRPRCEACREMHTSYFSRRDTQELLMRHFVVARIDMTDRRPLTDSTGKRTSGVALARSLGIQQVPTMVFFDGSGREVLRYEDHLTPEHFSGGMLTFLATHAYRSHASLQDWLRQRDTQVNR